MLLEAGADPSIAGGTQNITPLHIAAHLLVIVANIKSQLASRIYLSFLYLQLHLQVMYCTV